MCMYEYLHVYTYIYIMQYTAKILNFKGFVKFQRNQTASWNSVLAAVGTGDGHQGNSFTECVSGK